ncbi:uncharacterized protein LOC123223313 isoform X4 [Mangifera indica]|uniref:uncharacterized protein LOC123223313 isoform X4 n=1 Tax=Mangifera indica TaxID=29780 RepID=UPI001CFC2BA5|nr:uncharacterized protein LOC123223313 isoform X4 [Mangifera indica]
MNSIIVIFIGVSSVKCGRIQVDAVMVTVSDMVKSSQKLSHFVHRSCTLLPPVMTFLRRNQMYWLFRRRPICTSTMYKKNVYGFIVFHTLDLVGL